MKNALRNFNKNTNGLKVRKLDKEVITDMTWTTIQLSDRSMVKPYRTIEKKCTEMARTIEEKGYYSDEFLINLKDKKLSVIDSMIYLVLKLRQSDIQHKIGKQMNWKSIREFASFQSISSSHPALRVKGTINTSQREKEDSRTLIKTGLSDLPEYPLLIDDIKHSILHNPNMLGELMTEATVVSHICLAGAFNDYIVNPFNLHALVVACWSIKNNVLATSIKTMSIRIKELSPRGKAQIKPQDTLEYCIENLIKTEKSKQVAYSYLFEFWINDEKRTSEHDTSCDVFYKLLDDFMESIKAQIDSNKWLNKEFTSVKDIICREADNGDLVFRIMGKRNVNKYAYAILSGSILVGNYMSMYNMPASLLCIIHNKIENDTLLVSEKSYDKICQLAGLVGLQTTVSGVAFDAALCRNSSVRILSELDKSNQECDTLKSQLNESQDTAKDLKQQLRKSQKENRVLVTENKKLCDLIEKLEVQYRDNISKDDIDRAHSYIKKLTMDLEEAKESVSDTERNSFRKDKEIEKLRRELEVASSDYESICEQLDRARDRIVQLENIGSEPLKLVPFVNALNGKRIAVIGGDKIATLAYNLGLQFEHYKEHYNGLKSSDLSDMDLVIICTAYIGHTLKDAALNICKTKGIKVMYHTKSSVDTMIKAAFESIYSD